MTWCDILSLTVYFLLVDDEDSFINSLLLLDDGDNAHQFAFLGRLRCEEEEKDITEQMILLSTYDAKDPDTAAFVMCPSARITRALE